MTVSQKNVGKSRMNSASLVEQIVSAMEISGKKQMRVGGPFVDHDDLMLFVNTFAVMANLHRFDDTLQTSRGVYALNQFKVDGRLGKYLAMPRAAYLDVNDVYSNNLLAEWDVSEDFCKPSDFQMIQMEILGKFRAQPQMGEYSGSNPVALSPQLLLAKGSRVHCTDLEGANTLPLFLSDDTDLMRDGYFNQPLDEYLRMWAVNLFKSLIKK